MRYVKTAAMVVVIVFAVLFFLATCFVFHDPCFDFFDPMSAPGDTAERKVVAPTVQPLWRCRRKRGQARRGYGHLRYNA
jgi:hypothetical protein